MYDQIIKKKNHDQFDQGETLDRTIQMNSKQIHGNLKTLNKNNVISKMVTLNFSEIKQFADNKNDPKVSYFKVPPSNQNIPNKYFNSNLKKVYGKLGVNRMK